MCCKDNGIILTGTVVDSVTNEPLNKMKIKLTAKLVTNTDVNGFFNITIGSDLDEVVIRVKDKKRMYMDAVRIVDIAEGFRGPVELQLTMIKKADPVKINSTVESKLSLSADPLNLTAGNAFIVISPNSFTNRKGKPYTGSVKASITFVDSNSVSEDIIPGRFLTPVGGRLENMISDGIMSFGFSGADDKELIAGPIQFNFREGMRLWDLNTATGLWEPSKVLPVRRKRQVVLTEKFLKKVSSGRWYNIDKIPRAPRCYFKARIFDEASGAEITDSNVASFKPRIIAYTSQNQRLRLYARFTRSPNDTCFEVRCPKVANLNNSLAGFINMSSTESVSIGGVYLPLITYLKPKAIDNYDSSIKSVLDSVVKYKIAPNGVDMFVNFVSATGGPFYTDKRICENAPVDKPAFHFIKPEPPRYEPVTDDDSEMCTARIAFRNSWNFYNYTSSLASLPNVTGISVWQQDGQVYVSNDTVQMQASTVSGKDLVFVCLKYHCSPNNTNGTMPETTVYLDIHIPNITYSYNYTKQNGTVVQTNNSLPAFYCYGRCVGPMCSKRGHNVNGTSIEGSFLAPHDTGSGPDFFASETNNCADRSSSEPFAYEFRCHGNEENVRERELEEGRGLPM